MIRDHKTVSGFSPTPPKKRTINSVSNNRLWLIAPKTNLLKFENSPKKVILFINLSKFGIISQGKKYDSKAKRHDCRNSPENRSF